MNRRLEAGNPDWLPYTVIGDEAWDDYEVGVRVRLEAGETAAVMGRVNHVGTGYGFVPKCYLFELAADGTCRLLSVNGKEDKAELVGDAEQQAIIAAACSTDAGNASITRSFSRTSSSRSAPAWRNTSSAKRRYVMLDSLPASSTNVMRCMAPATSSSDSMRR